MTEAEPRCSCEAAGPWMSRCALHGWRGHTDPEHTRWLLAHYPQERQKILEAAVASVDTSTRT